MKGLIRGAAGLAVLLAMSACANDATVDLMGPPTGVQATPSKAFILKGDSVAILVRLVNDRNQAIAAQFDVANVGAGLSVAYDALYRPDYSTGNGTLQAPLVKSEQRYFAKGTGLGTSTFNLTSNGITQAVTITVSPKTLEAALNKTTGLVAGDTVTITAPAGLKFTPGSVVTLATGSVAIASRAADSSSIKFLVGPGAGGVATVTNVLRSYAPTLALLTLVTTNSIATTPAVTVAPTTASTLAPAFGATMTLTLGGNLRFTSTSTVSIGGRAAYIISRSADSATATIVPFGGSNGNVTYTNIVLSFLNGVPLAVPGNKVVTVGAAGNDATGGAIATAQTVPVPAVGTTVIWSDAGTYVAGGPCALGALGGDGCRYFKIVLAAPAKVNFELRWDPTNTSDLGLYFVNSTGTSGSIIADAAGNQAGGPETKAGYTLPAGTSYIAIVWYDYAPGTGMPAFSHVKVTGVP